MTKAEIFYSLVELKDERHAYLDTIPGDIQSAFFDNKAVEALEAAQDMLINAYFGEDAEAVFWFLYEWEPGSAVVLNDITTQINDIEDYITWMNWND